MQQKKNSSTRSIGMFDSGVGGLTVMQQIAKMLPNENIVYFGDTARLPYGGKSKDTIIRYSIENANFLMKHDIKLLVIPCNTASSFAVEKLQQILNIPVIGVIEPGAEKAVQVTRSGRIAVLGTRATVSSGIYKQEIEKRLSHAVVTSIACPLFVPLVEEGFVSHEAAKLIVRDHLSPLLNIGVDTIVLGCTHYPLLRHLIADFAGPDVMIVDSAVTCAEKVSAILKALQLHNEDSVSLPRYYVSDDPIKFRQLGRELVGLPIDDVHMALSHVNT